MTLTLLILPLPDIISNYSAVIYRTSYKTVGEAASGVMAERPLLHGINSKFSKHLSGAGNYINDSLKTNVEKDRYLNYCQDW